MSCIFLFFALCCPDSKRMHASVCFCKKVESNLKVRVFCSKQYILSDILILSKVAFFKRISGFFVKTTQYRAFFTLRCPCQDVCRCVSGIHLFFMLCSLDNLRLCDFSSCMQSIRAVDQTAQSEVSDSGILPCSGKRYNKRQRRSLNGTIFSCVLPSSTRGDPGLRKRIFLCAMQYPDLIYRSIAGTSCTW